MFKDVSRKNCQIFFFFDMVDGTWSQSIQKFWKLENKIAENHKLGYVL